MCWWLVAVLVAAEAAAPASRAPPLTDRRPDITESPPGKQGLVQFLRHRLMQDNEDYVPSESEAIPMRARLSGEYTDDNEYQAPTQSERRPEPVAPRGDQRKELHQKPFESRELRPAQNKTRVGSKEPPRSQPGQGESNPVHEEPELRDPGQAPVDQVEIHSDHDEPLDPQLARATPRDHIKPRVALAEGSFHDEPHYYHLDSEGYTHAVPTTNNSSLEKYNEDYEFKRKEQFPEFPSTQDHAVGVEGEVQKPGNLGTLKVEDAALVEIQNDVEGEAAHDAHFYEQETTRNGFMPRAHDDDGAISHLHVEVTTKTEVVSAPQKPGGADINVSKKDLLYYMDEEKFAKSNLSIGFNADIAIDYKDFAQGLPEPKTKKDPAADVPPEKKYRVLKMRSASGRRSGRGVRRFIQEEGAEGVAIINVDAGPFPEFRLPRERRQYMHSVDQSDADTEPTALEPSSTAQQPSGTGQQSTGTAHELSGTAHEPHRSLGHAMDQLSDR